MKLTLTDTAHGRMFVLSNDRYVGKALIEHGIYSPNEVDMFRQLIPSGTTVYDCGANQGAHTLAFAQIVGPTGRVVAFEPQRPFASLILADAFLNKLYNIVVMPVGLGATEGSMELSRLTYNEEESNYGVIELDAIKRDPNNQAFDTVEIRTLDKIALEVGPPSFMKIDVEGMEQTVLEGAQMILKNVRPWLWVESDRFDKNSSLLRFLESFGYRSWWTVLPQYGKNVDSGVVTFNFLCAPPGHNVEGIEFEATSENCDCPVNVVYDNA